MKRAVLILSLVLLSGCPCFMCPGRPAPDSSPPVIPEPSAETFDYRDML
jgi:hypothetical protein